MAERFDTPDRGRVPTAPTRQNTATGSERPSDAEVTFAALRTTWRLGQYCIVRLLGAGGMGEVYEALDSERGTSVALKLLPSMRPDRLLSFKHEFRTAASLAHPNIVELYELSVQNDTWFYSMELVDGIDLIEYVRGAHRAGPRADVEEVRLRACLSQLSEGVHELHRAGLLHLDLKPANVLVERGGRLVILDFGLVQSLRLGGGKGTGRSPAAGTPGYMAPEQNSGGPLTPAADWYAVGAILYEALAGRRLERAFGQLNVVPPSSIRAGVPADMEALCLRLLDPDPQKRPTAHELQALLRVRKASIAPPEAQRPDIEGREGQLARLVLAHEALLGGHAQCLFVSGAAGVGKTSLLDEWLRRIPPETQTLTLVAHCQEWESVPFKGFDAIVDQLAGHLRALPPEQSAELEQPAAAAAHLFPVLRGFAPPALAHDESTPVERRSRAFRGLRAILRKLSEQRPVCIAIDNLQWADADGARLLLELVSGSDAPRMLVVGVHRAGDEQSSPFLHSFFEQQRERGFAFDFEAFEVPPLDENDGRRLAARLLGARFTQETATRVALESSGNPLFLELFAQHLCEEAEAGSHDLDALTLRDVIDARLRRLAPSEQQIMDVVAVAGQPTEQRIVMAIAGADNDAQHALTMLRRGGWTRTGGPRIHDMIDISHQRLREGIVARMGRDRLTEIHAELAATLAPLPATDPERLARHYFGAGDASAAGRYAEIAADRAAAVLAFDRAAVLYQDALSTVSERGERWRSLCRRLGESLAAAGHCSAAARHFAAAVSGAAPAEALELRRLAGENHLVAGDIDAGLEALRPLLAEVDEPYPDSTPLMVASMIRDLLRSELPARFARNTSETHEEVAFRADLTWSLGKVLSAVLPLQGTYFMLRSLHDARAIDDVVRTGRVLAVLGAALSMQSGVGARLGRYYLGRARGMAKRAESEYLDGFCAIGEAVGALVAGQWTASRRGIDRGLELLQRGQVGVVWERNFGEAGAIRTLEMTGDLTELGRRAEAWYRDSTERGDRWSAGGGLYFSGLARLGQGEVGDVRRYARQAREDLSSTTYTLQHFYTMRLAALCDLYERRPEAAWARLDQEWHLIEKAHLLRVSLSRIDVLVLRAAILASHAPNHFGHDHSWRECENIAKRLSEEERPDGAAQALAIRGVLAARLGQPRAAIARLKEAARRFEDLDMQLLSAVNERAAAILADDGGRRKKADARLHKLGVKEPSLFAEVFLPAAVVGRPSSRPPDAKAALQK